MAVAALLTACSEEPEEVVDVGTRITTAADALECPTGSEVEEKTVSAGTRPGSEDALGAVQAWAKRARRSADIPLDGYHVARRGGRHGAATPTTRTGRPRSP